MKATRVDYLEDKAEGDCAGLPYTTELAGPGGVSVHFWLSEVEQLTRLTEAGLKHAIERIKAHRDVVRVTWSPGKPTGYWAHSNID